MKRTVTVESIAPSHSDERGVITDLLNRNISHVGLITTAKGAVRGSHYHLKSVQYSYVLSGSFEVLTASVKSPRRVTRHEVKAGELISIAPCTLHRFTALSETLMVDMISESREGGAYEKDVIRVPFEDGAFVPPTRSHKNT
jgi:quercetin dioxygenase-like cupin family protein